MPKKLKGIEKLLKQYFVFSTGERKGIIALLTLLFLLISLPYLFNLLLPKQPLAIDISTLNSLEETPVSYATYNNTEADHSLFTFDPNTVTNEELKQLGFSEFNVKTIRNYVSKGGKFRKADDLKKIFGIKPELFKTVEPFIAIAFQPKTERAFADSTKSTKKNTYNKVVELNSADSVELVALYRIGPALAHRILDYRAKLGGFVSIDQLKELWGFDEDILYDLQGKISVNPTLAKTYNVNTVTADELKTHPYFKFKLSNAIVNYRMQHGNYAKLEDLKKIVLVNDSVYSRITQYLHF